jgi:hypothetical protein
LLLAIAALSLSSSWAAAQAPPGPSGGVVRLAITCVATPCDRDFFRTEILFVDHVLERQDADVHLLVTSEATAGDGREITYAFLGQGRFAGRDQVVRDQVVAAASADTVRRQMVRVISLGLVPYALDSPAAATLGLTTRPPGGTLTARGPDPWNRFTFRTQLSSTGSGEQSSRYSTFSGSFGVSRTTPDTKLAIATSGSYSENRFALPDNRKYTSVNRRQATTALLAKSLGGHWSVGGRASLSSSTFQNLDHAWYAAPAVEYDVFPYAESTRRLLTLHYSVGVRAFDYRTETVYGKLRERTLAHALALSLTLRQPWGTASAGFDATSFLPTVARNRVNVSGNLDLNLARGLAVSLFGDVSAVHDQVYLPRGRATLEEILVRQRQLETGYQYSYSVGVSYSFGSLYSPVVNPRFGSGGF